MRFCKCINTAPFTEVAAILYTLFETAKLSGVDPLAYVTLAAKRAVADSGAVTLPSDLT